MRLPCSLGLSADEIRELQSRVRTLSYVGSAGLVLRALSGVEDAARLQGARVSSTVFGMLDAAPLMGRVLRATDDDPAGEPVIVLSHGMWQRFFGGDPHVLGRTLTLATVLGRRTQSPYTVVGVMPESFAYPDRQTRFWIPFQTVPPGAGPPLRGPMVALLADGVSIRSAEEEIGSVLREVRRQAPHTRYELVREQDELVEPVRPALLVLSGAVGFVLLIACVNMVNLLLARNSARQREMAIRTAIGAGRGRLVRQMLTESLILACLGGLAGTALALGGVRLVRRLAATLSRVDLAASLAFPRVDEIAVDAHVLMFTAALCVVTGLLFGLVPALGSSQPGAIDALRGTVPTVSTRGPIRHLGTRNALVVAEAAMAMVLLVAGGLLIRSFMKLSTVDPGYRAARVLTFQVSLPVDRYPDTRLRMFAEELTARLRAVPGVQTAAYANQLPMVNLSDSAGGLWTTPDAKRQPAPGGPDARLVSQDYLELLGIRIVAGRGFGSKDREGEPRVLLVNQALVNRDFGGENPIGQFVFVGRDIVPWQIVGIVDNVRQFALDRAPEPQFFVDVRQWSGSGTLFPIGAYYAVRTAGDPLALVPHVRRIVGQLDDQAALFNVAPMQQLVAGTLARPRMYAVLVGTFAAAGLALALVGIYGVIAYSVTQRTREIGIRMSLGAQRFDVLGLLLRESLMMTALGIGLGLAGAAAMSRSLEGMLFGLTPLDATTFAAVSVTFLVVATLASYVPARRATKVDPLIALRHD